MRDRFCMLVLLGTALSVPLQAKQDASEAAPAVQIRVLDGRNGTPIKDEVINLWFDEQEGSPVPLQTNESGIAFVPASPAPALRVIWSATAYVDCRKRQADAPLTAYSLKEIVEHGLAAEDTCGSPGFRRHAGELIVFVRPRRWYDGAR